MQENPRPAPATLNNQWDGCVERLRVHVPAGGLLVLAAILACGSLLVRSSSAQAQDSAQAEVSSQRSQTVLRGHAGTLKMAAFSPDGQLIATSSFDSTARVWDGATGQTVAVLQGHTKPVTSMVFSPNGQSLLLTAEPPHNESQDRLNRSLTVA